jgi:5-methylcytosine-specific restriction enzyme A
MAKLKSMKPRLEAKDTNPVRLAPKTADAHYVSVEHRAWRSAVLQRAGYRCEYTNGHGIRCERAYPHHRLYADHRVELRDGGSRLDPSNGWILCSEHHTRKTNEARAERWR